MDVHFNVLLQKHQEVQNNDDYRKMAINILILIETNWLIDDGDERFGADFPQGIMILENYGKAGDYFSTVHSRDIATKRRNFLCGSTNVYRDLLKFYRKRITCKCLKKRHLEARKTMPKMGECNHCGEAKERRLLMVCSRCMIVQYCSRKCQVAALPEHRGDCDIFVRAHNNIPGNYNFLPGNHIAYQHKSEGYHSGVFRYTYTLESKHRTYSYCKGSSI